MLVIDAEAGVTRAGPPDCQPHPARQQTLRHRHQQVGPARARRRARRPRPSTAFRQEHLDRAQAELFFLSHAPFVTLSALQNQSVGRLFIAVESVRSAANQSIGTGPLNRLFQAAMELQPPPMRENKRYKLLYATQLDDKRNTVIPIPAFLLFVNDPAPAHGQLPQVPGEQDARGLPLPRPADPAQAARPRAEGNLSRNSEKACRKARRASGVVLQGRDGSPSHSPASDDGG